MSSSSLGRPVRLASDEELAGLVRCCHEQGYPRAGKRIGDALFANLGAAGSSSQFLDDYGICLHHTGEYRRSFEVINLLLERRDYEEHRPRLQARRCLCVPHLKDRYLSYPDQIVAALWEKRRERAGAAGAAPPEITFTITTCKRLDLFRTTMNSFLACCRDIGRIGEWICVDDDSSEEDREAMKRLYPFFVYCWKTPAEKGHARSMNILRSMVRSPYVLHLEDDWQFFDRRDFCSLSLEILAEDPLIGQVLLNSNYAETLDDVAMEGGLPRFTSRGRPYLLHEHRAPGSPRPEDSERRCRGPSHAYWPHFSLRPSLLRRRIWEELGPFDESPACHFEMAYAERYTRNGYRSASLDRIHCLHTGRLTTERNDPTRKNAYDLNGQPQFGHMSGAMAATLPVAPAEPRWAGQATGKDGLVRVKLIADWCSSKEVCDLWNKMSKGAYRWNDVQVTWTDEDVDYYAIINGAGPGEAWVPERSILFVMEPGYEARHLHPRRFLQVRDHRRHPNNIEWHLGRTYAQLKAETPLKTRLISAVISSKYDQPGHRKRVEFLKFLEARGFRLDLYGRQNDFGFASYAGPLPEHCKDEGLLPYKYTFNAESTTLTNYFTEKIVDAILAECLCFYWGCPNIGEHLDPRAYIVLDLDDPDASYRTMVTAIEHDEWEKRIDIIRREKHRILDELQFFPTLERIVRQHRLAARAFRGDLPLVREVEYLVERYSLATGESTRKDQAMSAYLSALFPAERASAAGRALFLSLDADDAAPLENLDALVDRCAAVVGVRGSKTAPAVTEQLYSASVSYRCGAARIVLPRQWITIDRDVPIRVINLDRRADRWRRTVKALFAAGVPYASRVSAVDGRDLQATEEILRLFRDNDFGSRRAVIGCALSHIRLWRELAAAPSDDATFLILEDDITLHRDFLAEWSRRYDELRAVDPGWDLLYLGFHSATAGGAGGNGGRRVERLEARPDGMIGGSFAYLVCRGGARKLLAWMTEGGVRHGIDHYMMLHLAKMRAYAVIPHIVFSDYARADHAVDSDIQYDWAPVGREAQEPAPSCG